MENISGEYYKNYKINKLIRTSNGVKLYYGDNAEFLIGEKDSFGNHADEALSIIENPSEDEKNILSNFHYKKYCCYSYR